MWVYTEFLVSDLLDRIRRDLDKRLAALRPAVEEHARLRRAYDALEQSMSSDSHAVVLPPPRYAEAPPRRDGTKPAGRRRTDRTGRTAVRAAPGQTQLRVIEQLRSGPGSTSTTVANALGISANAAAATISRLVKQGRVQRLETGGYAPAEAPSDGPPPQQPPAPPADPTA